MIIPDVVPHEGFWVSEYGSSATKLLMCYFGHVVFWILVVVCASDTLGGLL